MIAYPKSGSPAGSALSVRLIGLGNAGVHLADRVAMSGVAGVEVIAMNTDSQSLISSICQRKVTLGEKATRGLGAGGDPDVGVEAAAESRSEIHAAVEGAGLVFLCAGLGGGTGSGIAPLIAEAAREAGATVFVLATSPFGFEGRRRGLQAAASLAAISRHANVIVHFENDRMSELASPRSGIGETFAASDALLSACVSSLVGILRGGGPMPVGLSDLMAALGGGTAAGAFGRGEGTGDNRAHDALARALKSPLLDRGRLLSESHSVVVHISGPSSLTFAEVSAIMQELGKHIADDARLFLGVATLAGTADPVCVTLLGNFEGTGPERAALPAAVPAAAPAPPPRARAEHRESRPAPAPAAVPVPAVAPAPSEESKPLFPEAAPEPERPAIAARQPAREPKAAPAPKPAPAPPKVKQETLQFESVARGRFEKSEPTIVEGEDLDVPTFLRLRGKAK
jgi:cell division protein FtsZ